jgi:thioredoxin 1
MGRVTEADQATFFSEVERSPLPVLVDFWAPWCRPCRLVTPALHQIAEAYHGKAKVVQVNADLNQELTSRFGITGLPTVLLFANGQVRASAMGVRPKEEYIRYIETVLAD